MAEENFVHKTLDKMLDVIKVELKLPLGIAEVKMSPTEIAKEWRENKKKRNELENAIQRAEEKFIEANSDNRIAQMLHEFPLYAEEDFKKVIAELLTHLSEEEISWLAEVKLIKIWGSITNTEEIRNALELYIPYLRHELSTIEEFRDAVSSLSLERIEEGVGRIDQRTEKIDKATERIEDKLDEALKSKQDRPVSLKAGWFYGHQYGDLAVFTGRAAELKMLSDWLGDDKDNLLVVRALGGFGKSALAWQWFNNKVNNQKWETAIWWSFYEKESGFESFLAHALAYLRIETKDRLPRLQLNDLLEAMRRTNILIVLDGFERLLRQYGRMDAALQPDNEDAEIDPSQRDCSSPLTETFLRGLSGAGMRSKVLMTTRLTPRILESADGKLLKGCREVELNAMSKADAAEFFHKQKIEGKRDEIEAACEAYGNHPLSLNLLVGWINREDGNEHRGDIVEAKNLDIFDNIKARRHHVLERAYGSLIPERRDLLSKISCFRGSMDYAVLKKVFPSPDLEVALLDLRKRGLLQYAGETQRYDIHPIVRHYAYDHFTDEKRRKEAHVQLAEHFIDAMPVTNTKVKTLEDLAPVIELYHHMVRAGNLDEACDLFNDRLSGQLLYQFGAYQLRIELLHALFLDGEDKPPRLKKESDQAWTLNELSADYALSGQPRRAVPLLEMNLVIREKQGKKVSIAIVRGNMATQQLVIGALSAAERNLRRQIELCLEIADELREAVGHQELGRVLSHRKVWQGADDNLLAAQDIFEKYQTNYRSVNWSYRALRFLLMAREVVGSNRLSVASIKSAIECAQRALELADDTARKKNPFPVDYMRAYWLLGAAYRKNGDLGQAEENLSKAIRICRQINMVYFEADILLDLARLRYAQGDFKDAQEKSFDALVITERSGYVLQGADVNLFLAQYALEQEKDKENAKEYAEKAKELAYCDGGEYKYKVAYEEAERFLENL